MGVQGLTTFVEENRNVLQDVKLRDSRLVIDGCSLYFRLYFTQNLDQQHGGDYDAFACLLSQFLSALAACNIQPYVVLDGGIDPSEKKFPTLRQRLQSKIREADGLSHGRSGSVLPIITRDVFIQVLIQNGVPVVQCQAEADLEIACLARQWSCPVLSNDSDFYIFDLPGGYLPLKFFQWTNLRGKASQRYILARCYTTEALRGLFGMRTTDVLPLFAVLTGNDYGAPRDAEKLINILFGGTVGRGGGKSKDGPSRIEALLLWLSCFKSSAEALEEVDGLMSQHSRDGGGRGKRGQVGGLSLQLLAGMQEYDIFHQSSLARWFSGSGKALMGEIPGLPDCLSLAVAQGLLAPLVVDAVVMQRVLLMPQVENSKQDSSHCCARAIRQAVYGILLQKEQDVQAQEMRVQQNTNQDMRGRRGRGGRGWVGGQVGGGRGRAVILPIHHGGSVAAGAATVQSQGSSVPICVEEYDRQLLDLKKNQVEAHPPRTPLHLETLEQAPVAVRLSVLLEVLGVRESALARVPLHLRLAVAVTGFWLREAKPTPSPPQLQALLLGLVYGELSWSKQPGAAHFRHSVPQLNWAVECNVWEGLDRLRARPRDRRGLDIGAAHSFSQWQACLWSALCLNQLLLRPMPEPRLQWVFSGTLVHGLLRYLKGGQGAESIVVGGSWSGQLYSSLLDAVRNCSTKTHPFPSARGGRRRRGGGRGRRGRGGGGRGGRGGATGTDEINNRFALLMSEEESDEYAYAY